MVGSALRKQSCTYARAGACARSERHPHGQKSRVARASVSIGNTRTREASFRQHNNEYHGSGGVRIADGSRDDVQRCVAEDGGFETFTIPGTAGACQSQVEAFASCNHVVTDEPAPCCWRDCTMIWITPVWLMSLVLLPLQLVKTEDVDSQSNSGWLVLTMLVNVAYMVFTFIFAMKPCVPPGQDAASRHARLTSKLNQRVCVGIVVCCFGVLFALIAFLSDEGARYSMPCCNCVKQLHLPFTSAFFQLRNINT